MKQINFYNPTFHAKELSLLASRNALPADMLKVIRCIEDGSVDTAPWITHRCGMESLEAELPEWLKPESQVVKAMLEIA